MEAGASRNSSRREACRVTQHTDSTNEGGMIFYLGGGIIFYLGGELFFT